MSDIIHIFKWRQQDLWHIFICLFHSKWLPFQFLVSFWVYQINLCSFWQCNNRVWFEILQFKDWDLFSWFSSGLDGSSMAKVGVWRTVEFYEIVFPNPLRGTVKILSDQSTTYLNAWHHSHCLDCLALNNNNHCIYNCSVFKTQPTAFQPVHCVTLKKVK